jgi:hypothetical protein
LPWERAIKSGGVRIAIADADWFDRAEAKQKQK